jgi:D-glycero-D-manno-heptose 1,7-bisphosphate phosphatase
LDRDGVVIQERHYLSNPELVTLIPGSVDAMREAKDHGYWLVGVTNQSGIGRGKFTMADFEAVQKRVDQLLGEAGIRFDAFFYCPHAPEDNCDCRKPKPGLLEEAARWLPWDPQKSWVVGDKLSDLELARRAGLNGILVTTGYGHEQAALLPADDPFTVVADLAAAVRFILSGEGA